MRSTSKRQPPNRPTPTILATLLCLGLTGWAGGCGQSAQQRLKKEGFDRNPVGVPPEAKLVRHSLSSSGGMLDPNSWFGSDDVTFRPTTAGRVWVVDELNGKVVHTLSMRGGDKLVVSPKENQIRLNGADVYGRKLPDEHGFLIYFAPEAEGGGGGGAGPMREGGGSGDRPNPSSRSDPTSNQQANRPQVSSGNHSGSSSPTRTRPDPQATSEGAGPSGRS